MTSSRNTPLSRKNLWLGALLVAAALLLTTGAALSRAGASPAEQTNGFHPTFALLDSDGVNVLSSGQPVSTMNTCGQCHDAEFISRHSFHSAAGLDDFSSPGAVANGRIWDTSNGQFGNWDPITYRYLSPAGDERIDLTTAGWVMLYGARHVGGGPAETGRAGQALASLRPDASDPEAAILDAHTGQTKAWDWESSGTVEMNCFLCHLSQPDNAARIAALEAGRFAWANTATLAATGWVIPAGNVYAWNPDAFVENGELKPEFVAIQDPAAANCGLCHGQVNADLSQPVVLGDSFAADWRTLTTGQVISGQRISNSGINLQSKAEITRSWDIHAERGLECVDCHYSLNNPVLAQRDPASQPEHLLFDPRRLDLSAYLYQPLHEFARGQSAQSAVAPELWNTMRRCDSCHDAAASHTWLPYAERHTAALACETCHSPQIYAPALQSRDWTVLDANHQPLSEFRGTDGSPADPAALVSGYRPVILPRQMVDGGAALAPYNLVTAWYWVYGDPARPVRLIDLEDAWFDSRAYSVEVLALFDADGDGQLSDLELRLDTDEKVALIAARLAALGLEDPRIQAEVQAYSINHNVTNGEWAIRDCSACHSADSILTAGFDLAAYAPGNTLPEFVAAGDSGGVMLGNESALFYQPAPQQAGLYILGRDSVTWVDWFGILAFLGTLAGVSLHGGLRWWSIARRKPAAPAVEKVYMYGVYERFWHWMQTITILLLIVTGLIIHKPDMFRAFSFHGVVVVHNVLAFLLVANAALSLFYHLASGEIRQYIPRPYGFFDQMFVQARFYLRGIFRGEPHPFEKSPQNKLNPLQKVVYFGILNVLLPLQVLTGALMWGAQRWPDLAARLGGLPFLAPAHTLVAWLFAAFIVAHVYLTTTGHEPLASMRAMMLGWDEVETHTG
ncbi:MAG: cytochrome b/b6 domain-containing protein [Chloroflexi bacterium]|nr:cytochrome b/b6 domain-containing protein [Chloroflexota bacterium]